MRSIGAVVPLLQQCYELVMSSFLLHHLHGRRSSCAVEDRLGLLLRPVQPDHQDELVLRRGQPVRFLVRTSYYLLLITCPPILSSPSTAPCPVSLPPLSLLWRKSLWRDKLSCQILLNRTGIITCGKRTTRKITMFRDLFTAGIFTGRRRRALQQI
jgi:hypothetical protein